MRRYPFAALLLLGLSPLACSTHDSIAAGPVADLGAEGVTARVRDGQIELRNGSSDRIYFATLERRYFETALALWCFGHPQCGVALDAGTTKQVEIARIGGYNEQSSEVIVFWWRDRPSTTGDEPPPVKQIIVAIH